MVAVHVVGVRVMVVMSNFPRVVREHQGHHADGANNLIQSAILGEGLMGTIVGNNKEA